MLNYCSLKEYFVLLICHYRIFNIIFHIGYTLMSFRVESMSLRTSSNLATCPCGYGKSNYEMDAMSDECLILFGHEMVDQYCYMVYIFVHK